MLSKNTLVKVKYVFDNKIHYIVGWVYEDGEKSISLFSKYPEYSLYRELIFKDKDTKITILEAADKSLFKSMEILTRLGKVKNGDA